MSTTPTLRDRHRRTLNALFAHPAVHNLSWSDVLSLLGQVGSVTEMPNGKVRTTVGGRSVSWEPEGSQVPEPDVLALRSFLQTAGLTPQTEEARRLPTVSGPRARRAAVVVTFRDAQVYGDWDGPIVLLQPFDPRGHLRHMHEKAGQQSGFYQEPQPEYYARIADAVRGFDEVLLLGHGKGHSSAMTQLAAYIDQREPELARRIVGGVDLDVGDLTEAEVQHAVHEFFGEADRPAVEPVPHRSTS